MTAVLSLDRTAPGHILPGTAVRALIIEILAGVTDMPQSVWEDFVGEVEVLPIASHAASNWRVEGIGTLYETSAVTKAAEVVRIHHPYAEA